MPACAGVEGVSNEWSDRSGGWLEIHGERKGAGRTDSWRGTIAHESHQSLAGRRLRVTGRVLESFSASGRSLAFVSSRHELTRQAQVHRRG